jgi:hypothetical protein
VGLLFIVRYRADGAAVFTNRQSGNKYILSEDEEGYRVHSDSARLTIVTPSRPDAMRYIELAERTG